MGVSMGTLRRAIVNLLSNRDGQPFVVAATTFAQLATVRSWLWCKALQSDLFCGSGAAWDGRETYGIDAIKIKAAPRYHVV